jgi:hypothetical protein
VEIVVFLPSNWSTPSQGELEGVEFAFHSVVALSGEADDPPSKVRLETVSKTEALRSWSPDMM